MQDRALQQVQLFSAISGLRLNVKKSVAIYIGLGEEQEAADKVDNSEDRQKDDTAIVKATASSRYLGHTAGEGDTTTEAWEKALAALGIRLALAEVKTNTVIQRAEIVAAIVIPKLMYVARHAWPTEEIIKRAELCVRNYVWNSKFRDPQRPPAGWVGAALAEQNKMTGGLGVPNLRKELMAMSAMVVGEWALSTKPQQTLVGNVLQMRDTGKCDHIVPTDRLPKTEVKSTLWGTGRPWTARHFYDISGPKQGVEEAIRELRKVLRPSRGASAKWTAKGLEVRCTGEALAKIRNTKTKRRAESGACQLTAIRQLPIEQIRVGNAQGEDLPWSGYGELYPALKHKVIGQVMKMVPQAEGAVLFEPLVHKLPMTSMAAGEFREICLSVVANFPELVGWKEKESILHVKHPLEDPHHVFEIKGDVESSVFHTWGAEERRVEWNPNTEQLEDKIAQLLEVPQGSVSIAPHERLTRLNALWAGRRRWTQSRRKYKVLMGQKAVKAASEAMNKIDEDLARGHPVVAAALKRISWKKVHRMEGTAPYQTQNICKLKWNRLIVWAGRTEGLKCQAQKCATAKEGGAIHIVWNCPDAQSFWADFTRQWGWRPKSKAKVMDEQAADIFAFELRRMPEWLVQWGEQEQIDVWEDLHRTAEEMWAIGVATMITVIWRWNVDRVHPEGRKERQVLEELGWARGAVKEAYARYSLRLYPLTANTATRLKVAEAIRGRWVSVEHTQEEDPTTRHTRVGFFDGGSRGNPGPGGSGSVIVQMDTAGGDPRPVWVAATALGATNMTNNVAEFTGLLRLLQYAATKGWRYLHIVGDSAMILKLMKERRPPRAKNLKALYKAACRLADICRVCSWTHHYRKHNKMADWLANQAMDSKRSVMVTAAEGGGRHPLFRGIQERLEGDFGNWAAQQSGGDVEGVIAESGAQPVRM